MSFKFKVSVGDHKFGIKELSFMEYKNVCKAVTFETDIAAINSALNDVIDLYISTDVKHISLKEKIYLLLEIRGLLLGSEIKISLEGVNISIDKSTIIDAFNRYNDEDILFSTKDLELTISSIKNFIVPDTNIIDIICDCVSNIVFCGKTLPINDLTTEDKKKVIYSLPGLPFVDIFDKIKEKYQRVDINIGLPDTLNISIFDGSLSHFIKVILAENYGDILDVEYMLRRKLSFNTYDLEVTPYAECQIMLSKLNKELKDREPSGGQSQI